MKNKIKILTTAITITLILALILTAPLHKETIPTKFTAGENPGFDLTHGILSFGKITPGSSATRVITITNNYNHPTSTKIKSQGQISPYIIVSQNNFILQPSQSKNITFSVYPTEEIELKEYPGQITITTHRA